MNTFVIGDVHGEYEALLSLVAKTPNESKFIFVGDLVDRGAQSAAVVKFIRDNNFPCVQGNHEVMMIEYGSKFIEDVKNNRPVDQENLWLTHGGRETLLSYGLVYIENDVIIPHPFIKEFIAHFKDDIEWMKALPLYMEWDSKINSTRKIVISHSAISSVWRLRSSQNQEDFKKFSNVVQWGRGNPVDNESIFNIFGHTPQKLGPNMKQHYVNVDTGCYMKKKGYGLLSAYCIETKEVYSAKSVSYDKVS